LHLDHFEKLSVQRKSASFIVFRRSRLKTDFALGDVHLTPLDREYFSDSHPSEIHPDENAPRVFRKRGT
jgi:hypothetical protein